MVVSFVSRLATAEFDRRGTQPSLKTFPFAFHLSSNANNQYLGPCHVVTSIAPYFALLSLRLEVDSTVFSHLVYMYSTHLVKLGTRASADFWLWRLHALSVHAGT